MFKTCPYVRDESKIRFRIFAIFLSVWEKSKIRNYHFLRLGQIKDSNLSLCFLGRPGKEGGGEGTVRVARPLHLSFSLPNPIVARIEHLLLVGHCGGAGEGKEGEGGVPDVVPIYVGVSA